MPSVISLENELPGAMSHATELDLRRPLLRPECRELESECPAEV